MSASEWRDGLLRVDKGASQTSKHVRRGFRQEWAAPQESANRGRVALRAQALSSSKCNVGRFQLSFPSLVRRHPIRRLSRTIVQARGNRVEFRLCQGSEIGALRQILAKQAIGVFVGSTLPRTVRVGEVDLQLQLLAQ